MTRILWIVVVLVLLAGPMQAQTRTLQWDAPVDVLTLAAANQMTWLLTVNDAAAPVVIAGVTCTGTTAPFQCAAPVPAGVPAVYDTKVELQTRTPGGAVSAKSAPFLTPTAVPRNVRTVTP